MRFCRIRPDLSHHHYVTPSDLFCISAEKCIMQKKPIAVNDIMNRSKPFIQELDSLRGSPELWSILIPLFCPISHSISIKSHFHPLCESCYECFHTLWSILCRSNLLSNYSGGTKPPREHLIKFAKVTKEAVINRAAVRWNILMSYKLTSEQFATGG